MTKPEPTKPMPSRFLSFTDGSIAVRMIVRGRGFAARAGGLHDCGRMRIVLRGRGFAARWAGGMIVRGRAFGAAGKTLV